MGFDEGFFEGLSVGRGVGAKDGFDVGGDNIGSGVTSNRGKTLSTDSGALGSICSPSSSFGASERFQVTSSSTKNSKFIPGEGLLSVIDFGVGCFVRLPVTVIVGFTVGLSVIRFRVGCFVGLPVTDFVVGCFVGPPVTGMRVGFAVSCFVGFTVGGFVSAWHHRRSRTPGKSVSDICSTVPPVPKYTCLAL